MKTRILVLLAAVVGICSAERLLAQTQPNVNCAPTNCIKVVCPPTIIRECRLITGLGYGAMVNLTPPSLTNICGGPVPPNATVISHPPAGPRFFPPGVHVVTACVSIQGAPGTPPYVDCCCYRIVVTGNCPPDDCAVRIQCPSNIVVCVTNGPGAFVNFPPPQISNPCNIPGVQVGPSMPSGSFFPIGRTRVAICADWIDPVTNQQRTECCCFDVVVRCCDVPCDPDRVPPEIRCPTNIVVTSPNCVPRPVNYPAPEVHDNCDGAPTVTCTPPPGSIFPVGTTTVVCCVTDQAGNTTCCTFTVTVVCPPPPSDPCVRVVCPDDIVVPCAGRDGAVVKWRSYAIDTCTGNILPVNCTPPPGSLFPPGVTEVCCTNVQNNVTTWCCFKVTVNDVPDTKPPEIRCPSNIVVLCASPNGARVNYHVEATDDCDTNVTLTCIPPPGTFFPPGCTNVVCIAVDNAGNVSQCTFQICVLPRGCYLRNPSFERLSPTAGPAAFCGNPINLAPPWMALAGTPDLFRPAAGVPANCRGQEQPCHGTNYAGLEGGYSNNVFQTEAMLGRLIAPLQNGQRYRLRGCLSLAESSPDPVYVEFLLANSANPGQQIVIHRERVGQKNGWQFVKPAPACFVVPPTGVWDALIIRAAQVPAGTPQYRLGYVYVDNVDICCCEPRLGPPTVTHDPTGKILRLMWRGDGMLRFTHDLGNSMGWMDLGDGDTDHADPEMHSQNFMVDSFFDVFFTIDAMEPAVDSFFDVFFDISVGDLDAMRSEDCGCK